MFFSGKGTRKMHEQLWFSGFEPKPPRHSLFFGLLAPTDSATIITKAADDLRHGFWLDGRLIAPERLHVSLHAIGGFDCLPNFIIERAYEAGSMVSASRFSLIFDSVVSFDNNRAKRPFVFLPGYDLARLFALHDVLGKASQDGTIPKVTFHAAHDVALRQPNGSGAAYKAYRNGSLRFRSRG
jgi:2'-5' RNA ligase